MQEALFKNGVHKVSRPVIATRPMRGFEVVLSQLGDTMGPDTIVGHVRGRLSFDVLREACWRVQQLQPTLRAAIRRPGGDRSARPEIHVFEPDLRALDVSMLEEPDDSASWSATHAAHWQWAAQEQSLHRFDLDHGFLFRVVWVPGRTLQDGHIIVCSHHAIVDGTSLMRLLNQLLRESDAVQRQVDAGAPTVVDAAARLPSVVPLPLPLPLFAHLRFNLLEKLLTRIGRSEVIQEQKKFISKPWLPLAKNAQVALADLRIRSLCVFGEGEDANWQSLHARCKEQGVTVGGAFAAAVQFAVCRHLQASGTALPMAGGKIAVPLSMDYNMRTRIDHGAIPEDAIGLGTSIASVGVKVPAEIEFWALARRLMDNARTQVKWRLPKLFQSVTDTIFDYPALLRRFGVDHGRVGGAGDGVNISNVGRYPFEIAFDAFSLDNVFGYNGACLSGPMFIFWLRQVNGHLCYNAMACSPAADRAMLRGLFIDVIEVMETLAARRGAPALTLASFTRSSTDSPTLSAPTFAN
jgi:hypothetical protein